MGAEGGATPPRESPPGATLARRWDLSHIFGSEEAFEAAFSALKRDIDTLDEHSGHLAKGPEALAAVLERVHDAGRRALMLHGYASMSADDDVRDAKAQARRERVEALFSELSAKSAFLDPEILALPEGRVREWLAASEELAPYRRTLEKIERARPHTLDAKGERLLGLSALVHGGGETVAGLLRNAELPWPEITLSSGEKLLVDQNGYSKARALPQREDRLAAFGAFFGALHAYRNTLGATVATTVKEHVFLARARGFDSCLKAALFRNEVDPAVYEMLLSEVNDALPRLHRYLELRRQLLGVERLGYHDIYAPLVPAVPLEFDWERAQATVLAGLAPLGGEYVERLATSFRSRWVDVDPRRGKRDGAYVNDSAYDAHPYMLLNHQDDFRSLTTLAHEAGHLMHSWYSQERQPYPNARYVIFVAEVASTFNEALLMHHLLERAEDERTQLALLGHHLDNLRGTVFRQTMFAEFELGMHQRVERGEALSGEQLSSDYHALLRRYHGVDAGVMEIDELYGCEWAFVPHFHYDFYVYQYATSQVAATALERRVRGGDGEALARYLDFLGAGSSKPPVELLADAGVDMTSPAPIRATMAEMDEVMDRIEQLIAGGNA